MAICSFSMKQIREILLAVEVTHYPAQFRDDLDWRVMTPTFHMLIYHHWGVREIRGAGYHYELSRDQVCFFLPNHTYELLIPPEPYHAWAIYFPPEPGDTFQSDIDLGQPLGDHSRLNCPIQMDVQNHLYVKELFTEIVALWNSHNEYRRNKASCLLAVLLSELQLWRQESTHPQDTRITQVTEHLQQHLGDKISVDDLTKRFGIPRRTLLSKFKEQTGQTIVTYQNSLRIRQAVGLIKARPELTLRAIGQELGFYDEFYFSKTFKRFTGQSPREFRSSK